MDLTPLRTLLFRLHPGDHLVVVNPMTVRNLLFLTSSRAYSLVETDLGFSRHTYTAHIRPRSKSNQFIELRCTSPLELCDPSSFALLHLYWERSSYIPNSSPIDNFLGPFHVLPRYFPPSAGSPIFLVLFPEKLVTPKLACHLFIFTSPIFLHTTKSVSFP